MKRGFVRNVAIAASLIIAASMFGGCQKKAETGKTVETKEEALTGNVIFYMSGDKPAAYDTVIKKINEKMAKDGLKTTVEIKFAGGSAGDYGNKLAMSAAAGDDIDIIWEHSSQITSAVDKGLVQPLDDALNKYGKEIKGVTPDYVFADVTRKGKIYSVPRVVPSAQTGYGIAYREDLRKKYNLPEIKTISDLQTFLDAIAKNEKGMIPYAGSVAGLYREYAAQDMFINGLNGDILYVDANDKDLKVKYYYDSPEFKNAADKINSWNESGLAPKDPKVATTIGTAEFNAGKIAAMASNLLWVAENIGNLKNTVPTAEIEFAFLNPDKPKYVIAAADNTLSVLANSKKVNQSVQFLNWVRTSQENYDLFNYGIEGVNYKAVGKNMDVAGISKENLYKIKTWMLTDFRFERFNSNLPESYKTKVQNWDKGAKTSPIIGFVVDPTPVKDIIANMKTIDDQYVNLIARGLIKYSDKIVEMDAKYKAAGLDKLIAEVQKQLDAYIATKKTK